MSKFKFKLFSLNLPATQPPDMVSVMEACGTTGKIKPQFSGQRTKDKNSRKPQSTRALHTSGKNQRLNKDIEDIKKTEGNFQQLKF